MQFVLKNKRNWKKLGLLQALPKPAFFEVAYKVVKFCYLGGALTLKCFPTVYYAGPWSRKPSRHITGTSSGAVL